MRKHLCIPKWLPFIAFMEHGWTALENPLKSDLAAKDFSLMFVYSKRRLEAYRKVKHNFKKIFIIGMPFILYRKKKKITKIKEAKGTVAFPSHGTDIIKTEYDINNYCNKLNELSFEFHPITICLHHDNMYQKEIYNSLGFNVVSAGSRYDSNFYFNFYEILKRHKYATSNIVGSHLFYSIDLNIPFFILGEEPEFTNYFSKDPNVPEKYKVSDFLYAKEAYIFFNTGPITNISKEQKKYIEKETGINDAPNRINLLLFYWLYFFQWACNKTSKKIIHKIKNLLLLPPHQLMDIEEFKKGWINFEATYYEAFSKSEIINGLTQNSVCIDCGANIGNITHLFASKDAIVYSFEPDQMCYEVLKKRFADNPKIHLINKGVLDKNMKLKMYKYKYHDSDELFFSQGNSLYSSNKEIVKDSYNIIEVIDIIEFIENLNMNIDILKLDIEGAEFCILDKLIDRKLYKKIKHILVETHDKEIPELGEIAQKVRDKIQKENITNIDLSWV